MTTRSISHSFTRETQRRALLSLHQNRPFSEKVIYCTPILGSIPSYLQEIVLTNNIEKEKREPRKVEWVRQVSRFFRYNQIRNAATASLILAGMGWGYAPSSWICIPSVIVEIGFFIVESIRIHKSDEIIQKLETVEEGDCFDLICSGK